jgi:hypothetical protein
MTFSQREIYIYIYIYKYFTVKHCYVLVYQHFSGLRVLQIFIAKSERTFVLCIRVISNYGTGDTASKGARPLSRAIGLSW